MVDCVREYVIPMISAQPIKSVRIVCVTLDVAVITPVPLMSLA